MVERVRIELPDQTSSAKVLAYSAVELARTAAGLQAQYCSNLRQAATELVMENWLPAAMYARQSVWVSVDGVQEHPQYVEALELQSQITMLTHG